MREQLLGYLLGALEPTEHHLVQVRLAQDPSLRQDLELLRSSLLPLCADGGPIEPPADLAARTCRGIDELRCEGECGFDDVATAAPAVVLFPESLTRADFAGEGSVNPVSAGLSPRGLSPRGSSPQSLSPQGPLPATFSSWRMQDLLVAAGILFASGWLLLPAVSQSRFDSRRIACENNLRRINAALGHYAQLAGGFFPLVPASGPLAAAGSYGPILQDSGLIEDPTCLVCPASALADEQSFRIPSQDEVLLASEDELPHLRALMGGTYGYGFGYVVQGRYVAHRNQGRATFALMSDAPERSLDGGSPNHGCCGLNVLFEDGHVEFRKICRIPEMDDYIFENFYGRVGAGVGPDDAVIGRSSDMPEFAAP